MVHSFSAHLAKKTVEHCSDWSTVLWNTALKAFSVVPFESATVFFALHYGTSALKAFSAVRTKTVALSNGTALKAFSAVSHKTVGQSEQCSTVFLAR